MRTLHIKPNQALKLGDWCKRSALETDVKTIITEDTLICGADEKPLLLYMRLDRNWTSLRNALLRIQYVASERTGGLKTVSRVFGFQPRIALRRDFCTAASLAYADTEANQLLCETGRMLDPIYRLHFPEAAARHDTQTQKVLPEWRMPGTVFTSGIINKNNPLKYHFDAGNFERVCSCMLGFKRGIIGGHLVLPQLDLALEIADGSVTIFDGQALLHGVSPIKRATPNAYRITVVYYALKAMWNCEPLASEVARIRAKRTEREFRRAGIPARSPVVKDNFVIDNNGQLLERSK